MIEIPENTTMEQAEKIVMLSALKQHFGNRTYVARQLEIGVRTVQRKFKKWGISPRAFRPRGTPLLKGTPSHVGDAHAT